MLEDIFRGELVRLVEDEPETFARAINRWSRDSEYLRLLATDIPVPYSQKAVQSWMEKELYATKPDLFHFTIHKLEDDCLIGDISLDGVQWQHGEAFLGIGLGQRSDWGKGYGTDATRLILRYAFTELNLQRISLNVFAYNQRAIRSYEKAGFQHEGCARQNLNREGQRWDMIYMGILSQEWEQRYKLGASGF